MNRYSALLTLTLLLPSAALAQFSEDAKTVPALAPGTGAPASCAWKAGSSGPTGDPEATLKRAYAEACAKMGVEAQCKDIVLRYVADQALWKSFNTVVAMRNSDVVKEMVGGKKTYPFLEWVATPLYPGAQSFAPGMRSLGEKASIAVTWHVFEIACSDGQLRWIMAHELAHLLNNHQKRLDAEYTKRFLDWFNQDGGKFKKAWFARKRDNAFEPMAPYFKEWEEEHTWSESPLNEFTIKLKAKNDYLPKDLNTSESPADAKRHSDEIDASIKATEADADKVADAAVGGSERSLKRLQDWYFALGIKEDPTHGMPLERLNTLKKK